MLKVFGIDFDEKTVRVARTLNLIAGDGEANVLHLNTLDFSRWNEKTEKDQKWINTYGRGYERLKKLRTETGQNKNFRFDILMANPPFAGDIKESHLLHQYDIALKNGHLIVEHDLHNHDGELPDGIAEAFIEWAKSEKLSFGN